MKVFKCILVNYLKLILSIAAACILVVAFISFTSHVSFMDVLLGRYQDVSALRNALKTIATKIPLVGRAFKVFFSINSVTNVNPSTGFEEFLSFIVFVPVVKLILKPMVSMIGNYTEGKKALNGSNLLCTGIDVVFNTVSLTFLSIVSAVVVLTPFRALLDWLRGIASSTAVYNIMLLVIGVVIGGVYCGIVYARTKRVKIWVTNLVLDVTLSLIILTLAYTVAIMGMYGGQSLLTETEILGIGVLLFILCVGLRFVLHLTKRYKEE